MATTTQNLGLIKPAGTDKIRIAQINSNMDTIDTKMGPVGSTPLQTQATNAASSISALQNGMAIVCNGNTHAAIPSGSYAYVRNHSSLAEGLYQATAAIAANDTLSSSNLVAVSGGGLNALKDKMDDRFKTVWTNPDAAQSFGMQTISVNLSAARMIIVQFAYSTSTTLKMCHLAPITNMRDLAVMSNTSGSFAVLARDLSWNATGVYFGNCYAHTSTSGGQLSNENMIPLIIMIIK